MVSSSDDVAVKKKETEKSTRKNSPARTFYVRICISCV